jgi:hypothetical protein
VRCNVIRNVVHSVAVALASMVLVISAAAQSPLLKNVELCNSEDPTSAEPQIAGCSALIALRVGNSKTLAIAYNNRGNAFASKGEYELAIKD